MTVQITDNSKGARRGEGKNRLLRKLLHASEPLTVEQLTKLLGISRNAVYQHIADLERENLVERDVQTVTRGRPGQTFRLSQEGRERFPRQYALIGGLLIAQIKKHRGSGELKEYFEELGRQLAQSEGAGLRDADWQARTDKIVGLMRELGYEAESGGVDASGVTEIRAQNCVFHELAQAHQEVCALDITLLETLFGTPIEHAECMAQGGACCRFKAIKPED
jgi:DeoR family suf operon transcriptional repressor